MSMVVLRNIPENLRYFLFKQKLTVKEFSLQINEPHSTLLAIIKGKIAKTNSKLCQKLAKTIGVDLTLLQTKLLESTPVSFSEPLPIIDYKGLVGCFSECVQIGSYETLNRSVDRSCFVVKTDLNFNYFPVIPSGCDIVLKPVFSSKTLKDGDTLLLLTEFNIILRIIEIHQSDKSTMISTLSSRLQVDNFFVLSEFENKYKILGRVVEIRHE